MRHLSVTGVVTRACRTPRAGTARLEHVTGQPLFLLTSETTDLRHLIGHVVRVSGRVLGRVIDTEAPLLEVSRVQVLATASLLQGGVQPFAPAILETSVPTDEFRLHPYG